jgi:hypothetical protein
MKRKVLKKQLHPLKKKLNHQKDEEEPENNTKNT